MKKILVRKQFSMLWFYAAVSAPYASVSVRTNRKTENRNPISIQPPKYLYYYFATLFIAIITTTTGFAQTTALTTAAQEAINKGIMATKVPDYVLAVRYFEEARKLAPQSPEVFFNLGLAESKIPGRELRAICWFGAYLTTSPGAANAAAVKEQMDMMMIKNQSNLNGLIKSVSDAAMQTNADMGGVAMLWAKSGDINAALKAADIYKGDPVLMDLYKSRAFQGIARVQTENGDFEGAKKTTDFIVKGDNKSEALTNIAEAQIKAGDIAGAKITLGASLKAADLIQKGWESYKSERLNAIAIAQLKAFDTVAARSTLILAQKTADQYDYVGKNLYQRIYAETQISAGDNDGAREVMLSAQKFVELNITDMHNKSGDLADIAKVLAKAGDFSNAQKAIVASQKAVNLIPETGDKNNMQKVIDYIRQQIARLQAKAGDISGAKETADDIRTPEVKSYTQKDIGEIQIKEAELQRKAGDLAGALKTLTSALKMGDILQEGNDKEMLLYYIAQALIEIAKLQMTAGDIEAVKKTLELTQKAAELIKGGGVHKDLIEWYATDISFPLTDTLFKKNDIAGTKKILGDVINSLENIQDPYWKMRIQERLIEKLVKILDIAGAQKITDLIKDAGVKNSARYSIVIAQAHAGDITGAQKTADLINNAGVKNSAQVIIAGAQSKAGNNAGAQITVDLIQDTLQKCYAEKEIAEAQIKNNDIPGAKKTILTALNYTQLIKDTSSRIYAMIAIAGSQIKAGDIIGSKSNFALVKDLADHISGLYERSTAFNKIAEVQIKFGDTAGAKASISFAKKAAESIQGLNELSWTYRAIAETQINVDDMAEVKKTLSELSQKTAELSPDSTFFNNYWKNILEVYTKAGITNVPKPTLKLALANLANKNLTEKITVWINRLEDKSDYYSGALNTDPFLDITGYLKTIPASEPQKYFEGLKNTANKIVNAQNLIEKMMKEIK